MKFYVAPLLLAVGLLVVSCDMNKQTRKTPSQQPKTPVTKISSEEKDVSSKSLAQSATQKPSPKTWWKNIWTSSSNTKTTSSPLPLPLFTLPEKITPAEIVFVISGLALGIHFLFKIFGK